jgi:hypothetical protein
MNNSSLSTPQTPLALGGGPTSTSSSLMMSSPSTTTSTSTQRPGSNPQPSSVPVSSSLPQQQYHHDEKLPKAYRAMGTAIVGILERAEKAVATEPMNIERCRDLDRAVVQFLHTRIQFHRLLGHVEAAMLGKAEEMESLETYVRTQPKLGSSINDRRKKKRRRRLLGTDDDDDDEVAILQKGTERETTSEVAVADCHGTSANTTTASADEARSGSADDPLVLDG